MMKEILITSSVLILALLLLRQLFRGVLSRRFQYALWALVLVRLLVPVSLLPATDFSVLTAAKPVEQAVAERVTLDRIFYSQPQGQVSPEELEKRNIDPQNVPTSQDLFAMGESDPDNPFSTNWLVRDPDSGSVTRYAHMEVGWGFFLEKVWKVGMILMGCFFLLSNLGFYIRLRKNRQPYAVFFEGGTRRVYLVPEGVVPSPCLFGRSIYITPAVAADENKLRHVLCHEETHARHWDPLWALLRCLCLTVYWFDPLVWVAARCSKTDCELACDESVLKALGEAERIPYGQTLLSLIPVKRASNPMIAATTMTAGKKQLRDRITRIAQRPRQLMAAALAVAVLACILAACTFTRDTGSPSQGPTESTLRSLTGEELRWFNEEFFNRNPNPAISYTYSIRNQFANPLNLYEKPEDIDLHELFYLEGRSPTAEELRAYGVADEKDLVCPVYVITAGEMDEILREYTGLSLEQANLESLGFDYVEAVDAYFNMHGDTNYCGELDFVCGTREGSTVKLYHSSDFNGSSWYCVTLEDRGGAGQVSGPYGDTPENGAEGASRYWFRSNVQCEAPQVPTPLPAWEPAAVIDLSGLEPYAAPAVAVTDYPHHYSFHYTTSYANWDIDGHHICVYRAEDGVIYAAYEENDIYHVFLSGLGEYVEVFFFHDLLGHDGFFVKYDGQYSEYAYGTVYDYYYFNPDGVLTLLARCEGHGSDVFALDLDGDGKQELCAEEQIFFQRGGTIYEARLPELLAEACPELSYWDQASWDKYGKVLRASGLAEGQSPEAYGYDWTRQLYFDGEHLLVYKNEAPTVDHMVAGADAGVPAVVVEKAAQAAQLGLVEADGFYRRSNYQEHEADGHIEQFDDWRIYGFYGPSVISLGGVTVEAWSFTSEVHAVEPASIVIAGGNYLTEDGWTWNYTADNTIFLRREEDGSLTYLWTGFDDGTLDSHMGREGLARDMEAHGIELAEGYSYAGLQAASDLELILDHSDDRVVLQLTTPDGKGGSYTVDPGEGNGPYYRNCFSAPGQYRWTRVEAPAQSPEGTTLVITNEYWYQMLQFWAGSDLVMSKGQNREPVWYRAELVGLPKTDALYEENRIFPLLRGWFDEAEVEKRKNIVLVDRGQLSYETARDFLTIYEEITKVSLTPGSRFACSYAKVVDLTCEYPDPADRSRFRFDYSLIFVPENELGAHYMMAGNTAPYEGDDPKVPQGAFQYRRRGTMYLEDGYWRCESIGTG